MLNACVVHHNIQTAKALCAKSHHGFNLSGLAHVSAVVFHTNAMRLACCRDLRPCMFHIPETVEQNVGALCRQRLGNAQTNAAGGTCD